MRRFDEAAPRAPALLSTTSRCLLLQSARWPICAGGGLLKPPGENIALGCKVTFESRPNYGLCTDDEDIIQLTDGKYSAGYFWVQKKHRGWNNVSPVTITIDLGKVQRSRASPTTLAQVRGRSGWPSFILVAVATTARLWRFVGDLVTLSTKNGLPSADTTRFTAMPPQTWRRVAATCA